MMDDTRLIQSIACGDDTALRALFDEHAPWLAVRLQRMLPLDAVEEVMQETFIAVWRGANSWNGDGDIGAWVWGIARRQAALWYRKNKRPVVPLPVSANDDPATVAARSVDLEAALEALDAEECGQGELARLLLIEDRSVADTAQQLGIPAGTVKSRAYRMRRFLRSALGEG
jgi:RNA polymerase sigma-70 factor (ECF subfamily)